ncbi:pyruvate/2-oxoglutarate dehydrogenase complex dihydrolipoamide dehydrogenase (E3) component [Palleronia aestuarii]|uniref:Pyruvate/2-oxoglutarate dehydrogenase complex dihydrolipoamide dehydrogenase (E3) component n=1 Tax=Palleronia aestuarii TaxID=568105 RepID=A0A2W7PS53_9RHOB|nr:FAD-dependent oxidoreductase [Palleronia aestuarii]PZX12259.1 pyruvate/2-oxoglutarate dehydrogenase complex dihydrolipoamide dehydrogenase (E3) component [Palleronia aestuarii]
MERIKTDICIIGAGSGGLSVAAGASQMGAQVVLIEGHEMGGDCLNYGCVPSKSLLASAKAAYGMTHPGDLGIAPAEPQVDYAAAKAHTRRVIETIAPVDSQERYEGFGVRVIRDWARFVSPTEVQAGAISITARRFVIATGSRPFVPPIDGIEDVPYLTNETLFDLSERPEHLLIIGGGPIGIEMAQAHIRLGSRVTVLETGKALAAHDPECAAIVLNRLREEGVEIVEGAQVTRIGSEDGSIIAETADRTYRGSHLLVAAGRRVNLDGLDPEAGNIACDKAVRVGDDLRSVTNRRVYAVGDAAGRLQFTHVAGYHAGIVVRSAVLGMRWAKARQDHLPRATYTDPELAEVGLGEEEARRRYGSKLEVVRSSYDHNDRAIAEGRKTGTIKVLVAGGKPCGAAIVGAHAGELVGMWAMAIANGQKMSAIANTVLPYPTFSEINKRAASGYFSPRLFDNPRLKTFVGLVQKYLP